MSIILLTNAGYPFIIDRIDYEWVTSTLWSHSHDPHTVYIVRSKRINKIKYGFKLHREVMTRRGIPIEGMQIDHKNNNGSDCRFDNLRVVTQSQNQANARIRRDSKSRFKGVCLHPLTGKWQATINKDKKPIYLGLHNTEIQAAEAYNAKAIELFGVFALLNVLS